MTTTEQDELHKADTKTHTDLCQATPPAAEVNQQLLESLQALRFDVFCDGYDEGTLYYDPCEEGSFLDYDQVVAILAAQSQEEQQ